MQLIISNSVDQLLEFHRFCEWLTKWSNGGLMEDTTRQIVRVSTRKFLTFN